MNKLAYMKGYMEKEAFKYTKAGKIAPRWLKSYWGALSGKSAKQAKNTWRGAAQMYRSKYPSAGMKGVGVDIGAKYNNPLAIGVKQAEKELAQKIIQRKLTRGLTLGAVSSPFLLGGNSGRQA